MDQPEQTGNGDADDLESGEPNDQAAEQSDPESAPASDPPPGQEPGEGKSHDL